MSAVGNSLKPSNLWTADKGSVWTSLVNYIVSAHYFPFCCAGNKQGKAHMDQPSSWDLGEEDGNEVIMLSKGHSQGKARLCSSSGSKGPCSRRMWKEVREGSPSGNAFLTWTLQWVGLLGEDREALHGQGQLHVPRLGAKGSWWVCEPAWEQ